MSVLPSARATHLADAVSLRARRGTPLAREADGPRARTTLVCRPLAAGESLWEDRCPRSREAPFELDI